MPNCPRCLNHFPTAKAISHHLQQPRLACNNSEWIHGTISIAHGQAVPAASHSQSPEPVIQVKSLGSDPTILDFDPGPQDDLDESTNAEDVQYDFEPLGPASSSGNDELGQAVDFFDGAGVICGAGQTFLMHFDLDEYSIHHSENLYYPFANLDNWQMANFLLMFQLSLQEIDEFLFLNMVSHS